MLLLLRFERWLPGRKELAVVYVLGEEETDRFTIFGGFTYD